MPSDVLGGRYTVQDKIGTGGMAIVYRGLDNVLGRTVAIKTMLPQYAADYSFAARFKQEAQAAAALQSPYIVSVYDWGKDGDTYYIVMEYLHGTDLKSGIRKHGALDCRKVAQIGSQISQALSVAHRHDIIHRDIKPQNIMVQPDGNIKVMDFGIARAKNSHLTTDNNVLGTAHYVSPEQTQGKELGPTSDIYSLGIVMYEATTGCVPFEGDDAISVALKQVNEQPIPPSQRNPQVDPQLEGIILKCMQKDPAARFQTAEELSRVLRDYLSGRMSAVADATAFIPASTAATAAAAATQRGQTQTMAMATPLIPAAGRNTAAGTAHGAAVHGGPINKEYAAQQAQEQAERQAKKRKRVFVISALAVVAIIAIVAVVIHFFTGQAKTTQKVPNLLNLTQEQAVQQIQSSNFFEVGEIKEEYNNNVEKGKVIDQNPDSNKDAEKGTKINLVISKGAEPASKVVVPNLANMTPEEAQKELEKAGLKAQAGESVHSDTVENGHVASQTPAAGTAAKEGDTITYQISLGPDKVAVPSVTGMTLQEAQKALTAAGFIPKVSDSKNSDTVPFNSIISYSPTGNTQKGATIYLTVSNGPTPRENPPKPDPSQSGNNPTTPNTPTDPNKKPAGGGGTNATGGGSNS